mgnify:CR=1 FL=1
MHLCNSPTKRARTVVAKETLVAQEPNSRTYHPKPDVPSLLGGRHNGIVAHLLDETRSERSAVGLDFVNSDKLTVRGTQALVICAPLAFKLFCAARQNAVLRRSPFRPV